MSASISSRGVPYSSAGEGMRGEGRGGEGNGYSVEVVVQVERGREGGSVGVRGREGPLGEGIRRCMKRV